MSHPRRAVLAVAVLCSCAASAQAADFHVNRNDDPTSGGCGTTANTLRWAARQAQFTNGDDRVVFDGPLTIGLTAGCGAISLSPGTSIDASALVVNHKPAIEVDCASTNNYGFVIDVSGGSDLTTSKTRSITGLAIGNCDKAIDNFITSDDAILNLTDTWVGLHLDGSASINHEGLDLLRTLAAVTMSRVAVGATLGGNPAASAVTISAGTFTIADSFFGVAPTYADFDPGGPRANSSSVSLAGKGTVTNSVFSTAQAGPGLNLSGGGPALNARWVLKGNRFGTKPDGTVAAFYGNAGAGLHQSDGAVLIGGTGAGEGNVLAGNGTAGIEVFHDVSAEIIGNSIFGNGALGITFDASAAILANDDLDADTHRTNFPVPTGATRNPDGSGVVAFDYTGAVTRSIRVDAYRNTACDASGNGEGLTYAGTTSVVTGAGDGKVSGAIPLTGLSSGDVLTLLATDLTSGGLPETSEFSACRTVVDTPTVSFDPPILSTEGNSAPFIIRRTGDTSGAASVRVFTTTAGTATPDVDFTPLNFVAHFAPGEATATLQVVTLQDSIDEPDETIGLSMADPVGVRYDTAPTMTLTIGDDDLPPAGVSLGFPTANTVVDEKTPSAGVVVRRTGSSAQPVQFHIATVGSTANAGEDFAALDRNFTIPAGENDAVVRVDLLDDKVHESSEVITLVLSDVIGATQQTQTATITITDDDPVVGPAATLASKLGKLPKPKHGKRIVIRGTTTPAGLASRVDISVVRWGKGCFVAKANGKLRKIKRGAKLTRGQCLRKGFARAKLAKKTGRFSRTFRRGLPKGRYFVASKARGGGIVEAIFDRKHGNFGALRVR